MTTPPPDPTPNMPYDRRERRDCIFWLDWDSPTRYLGYAFITWLVTSALANLWCIAYELLTILRH